MYKFILSLLVIFIIGCETEVSTEKKVKVSAEKSQVLYFGAAWCGPCKIMKAKVLNDPEVKRELEKRDFKMYDIDKSPDVKRKYGITVVPTTVIIKGKKMFKYNGYLSKSEFLNILSQ
jgi:thioredoxin 1